MKAPFVENAVFFPLDGFSSLVKDQATIGLWVSEQGDTKTHLNEKRTSGGITMPDLKLYYRAIMEKSAWYWYRDIEVNKWNRIEDPEMNPHTYGHLIFDKGTKTIQW